MYKNQNFETENFIKILWCRKLINFLKFNKWRFNINTILMNLDSYFHNSWVQKAPKSSKIDSFLRKWVRTSDRQTRIQALTGVLVGVRVQSSLGIGQEIFSYFGNGFGHEKIKTWDSDMDSDTITRRLFDQKCGNL